MRQQIFKDAWYYLKHGIVSDFSTALRLAWIRFKFTEWLRKGAKQFKYIRKSDRTVRSAFGTIYDTNFNDRPNIFTYWDLDKNGIRSFDLRFLLPFQS